MLILHSNLTKNIALLAVFNPMVFLFFRTTSVVGSNF